MIQGGSVLLLLSMFFAYLLAPAIDIVSRRVRLGRRGRPLTRTASLTLIYVILAVPIALGWRFAREPTRDPDPRIRPRAGYHASVESACGRRPTGHR